MRTLATAATIAALLAFGCSADAGPPLTVSDVVVYAPLTDNGMAVAYLTIHNNTGDALTINRVSSPDFGRAAMHETTVSHGVARMSAIESLTVPAQGYIALSEGGIHLMLMEPRGGPAVGERVSLHFHYAHDGILVVEAVLRQRRSASETF